MSRDDPFLESPPNVPPGERKDTDYSPSSDRDVEALQDDQAGSPALDDPDIDRSKVKVLPGTGDYDDDGQIDVEPGDVHVLPDPARGAQRRGDPRVVAGDDSTPCAHDLRDHVVATAHDGLLGGAAAGKLRLHGLQLLRGRRDQGLLEALVQRPDEQHRPSDRSHGGCERRRHRDPDPHVPAAEAASPTGHRWLAPRAHRSSRMR